MSQTKTANARIVIVSTISFFLGLQFSHSTSLFQTDCNVDHNATEYMTWAPDEIELSERRRNRGTRRRWQPKHPNSNAHTNSATQVKYLVVGDDEEIDDEDSPATVSLTEAFSASWWAPVSSFLRYERVEVVSAWVESACFHMFEDNIDRVRMTKDWLDFSVEHLSKWWKLLEHDDDALDRVIEIMMKYTSSRRFFDHGRGTNTNNVPQQTLVVIAYQPYAQPELTKWSLAATIASHASAGMGRIVVSGRLPAEEELIQEAFDIVKKQYRLDRTELSFCLALNEKTSDDETEFNLPKSALKKLRHVLLGKANEDIDCWLGETSTTIRKANTTQVVDSKWKYTFLTEPDTLLSTRQSSLVALGEALEKGYVLAPHRLQPVPHGDDFVGLEVVNEKSSVIPAVGSFEHVYDVDPSNMSCCDAGQFKPMSIFEPYDDFWWLTGFYELEAEESTMSIEEAHKHLLLYPFMRLKSGTNVVFAGSEHGKYCHLHFGAGVC